MRELKIVLVLAVVVAPAASLLAQSLPSGVHTHLDASDPLNNGGNTAGLEGTTVATWTDISGNARAFSAIGDPTWSATSGPNGLTGLHVSERYGAVLRVGRSGWHMEIH